MDLFFFHQFALFGFSSFHCLVLQRCRVFFFIGRLSSWVVKYHTAWMIKYHSDEKTTNCKENHRHCLAARSRFRRNICDFFMQYSTDLMPDLSFKNVRLTWCLIHPSKMLPVWLLDLQHKLYSPTAKWLIVVRVWCRLCSVSVFLISGLPLSSVSGPIKMCTKMQPQELCFLQQLWKWHWMVF